MSVSPSASSRTMSPTLSLPLAKTTREEARQNREDALRRAEEEGEDELLTAREIGVDVETPRLEPPLLVSDGMPDASGLFDIAEGQQTLGGRMSPSPVAGEAGNASGRNVAPLDVQLNPEGDAHPLDSTRAVDGKAVRSVRMSMAEQIRSRNKATNSVAPQPSQPSSGTVVTAKSGNAPNTGRAGEDSPGQSDTIKAVGHGGGADDYGRGSPNDSAESYNKIGGSKGAADESKPPASRLAFGDGTEKIPKANMLKKNRTFRQTLTGSSGKNLIGALTKKTGKSKQKTILKPSTDFEKKPELPETHIRARTITFNVQSTAKRTRLQTITWLGIKFDIVQQDSKAHMRWMHALVPPLTYETWAIPFRFSILHQGWGWGEALDIVFDIWFCIAILVTSLLVASESADKVKEKKRQMAKHFWRHTFPLYFFPSIFLYIFTSYDTSVWFWVTANLVRLPRVHLLMKYFNVMSMRLEVNARNLQILKLMLIILLSIHWTGCVFYFLARVQDFGDHTWVTRITDSVLLSPYAPGETDTGTQLKSYLLIMFKGITAMTNIGYDPLRPDNPSEMVWSVVVMIIQFFVEAYILGTLFHHLVAKDASLDDYRRKSEMLQSFMQDRDLPLHLRGKLSRYIEFSFKKSKDNYGVSLDIPRALELKIASCQFKEVVETCMVQGSPLRGCNEMFINTLMLNLEVTYLMPGEEFIRKGDIGRELGFVAGGVLDVIKVDHIELVQRSIHGNNLDMPTITGEIAFFLGTMQPYKVACRSNGDAKVLVLSREAYNDMLENYPEQHDTIVTNILANFGYDAKGENLPGWSNDSADDEDFMELRDIVHEAVIRFQDDMVHQLTYAVTMGEVDLVKNLIRKGVDVDTSNYDESSVLHMAAVSGNTKVLETLLEEGANKDIVDRWGHTPLHVAVVTGNTMAVDLLAKNGATLAVSDPAAELCTGAAAEDISQLERLVSNGIDPNLGDYDGRTALHLAAASGAQKSVEFLLAHGANPNVKDRWGGLPLMDAVKEGHGMVANIIRKHGGMLSLDGSGTGASELCDAAASGDVRMLTLLKDAGVNLDQGDYDHRFALHLAAANGKILPVSYLLSICADPMVTDRWNSTPLEDALLQGHMLTAKLLYSSGGALGPSPAPKVLEAFAKLDSIQLADARAVIKEQLQKGNDKKEIVTQRDEDVAALYTSSMKAMTFVFNIKAVADMIQLRYRTLSKRFKSFGFDIWEQIQLLEREGLAAVSASEKAEARGEKLEEGDAPGWMDKFHELDEMIEDRKSKPLQSGRLTVKELQLYEELDDLLDEMDQSEGDEEEEPEQNGEEGGGGEEDGDDAVKKMDSQELAKIFQSLIVAKLNELQTGFDTAVDDFYRVTRNAEEMMEQELVKFLAGLKCDVNEEMAKKVVDEIIHAKEEAGESVSGATENRVVCMRDLWLHSRTFWQILRGTERPKRSMNRILSRNLSRQGSTGARPEDTSSSGKPKAEEKRQTILNSMEIILDLYDVYKSGGGGVSTAMLSSMSKKLGEFGAPLFAQIFPPAKLSANTLGKAEFLGCFIGYLDPSCDDGPGVDGEGSDDEEEFVSLVDRHATKRPSPISRVTKEMKKGIDNLKESVSAAVMSIRVPVSNKTLRVKLLDRTTIRHYHPTFEATTGSLQKPLRRQNVKAFLSALLPRYLITESHCDLFVDMVSGNNTDGVISWESIVLYLKSAMEDDPDEQETGETGQAIVQTNLRPPLPRFIISPESKLMKAWNKLILYCAVYNFFVVPIQICSVQVQESFAVMVVNYTVDFLFLVDIVFSFLTAYYDENSILVTDRKRIFNKYVTSDFLFDLPIAVPLSLIAWASSSQVKAWLRLPKALRLHLVYKHWRNSNTNVQGQSMLQSISRLLFMTLAVSHICASIFLFLGRYGSPGWLSRGLDYGAHYEDQVWDNYLVAFYVVFSTFSTQGVVGELTPSTFQEVLLAFFLMILTITLFAYVLGEISSLIMKADDEVAEARGKQAVVENFIKSKRGITDEIADEVRAYAHNTSSQGHDVDLDAIYKLMSHSLQVQVAQCISRDFLDDVPLFKDCTPVFLDSLSVLMREAQYAMGDTIFRANEVSKHLYIIVTGAAERWLEVEDEDPLLDGKSIAGQCVGDLSFFFGMRQIYTCKTVALTTCFLLERGIFKQILKMYPDEDDTIARNALSSYEATMNRAGSMASGKSGASAKSVQSELDNIMGSNLKHTIRVLKHRRKVEALERGLKAASRGNIPDLQKIFLGGVGVNTSNRDGRTCLHVAACHGRDAVVKFLVDEMRADLNPVDTHGNTPINDAVRHKQDECAKILRDHGARLKLPPCDLAVILCDAAFQNDLEMLRRYIDNGGDPGAGDYDGRTCLHLAACEGRVEIIKYLLEQDVDVNCVDRLGCTPLEDAIRHNHRDVQLLLREKGAVLNGHATAICKAAASGDIDTIRTLISNGIDPNHGDYDGRTALHLAACENQLGVIHFLLRYNTLPEYAGLEPCCINPVDSFGGTPLDDAIRHGNKVVEILLRENGGVCKEDPDAVEEAKRAQEKSKVALFRSTVNLMADKMVRGSMEFRQLRAYEAYLELTRGYDKVLDGALTNLNKELGELLIKEREYVSKVKVKRARNADKTAHQRRMQSMREAVRDLIPMLQDWKDTLENPPTVKLAVHRRLIASTQTEDDESEEEEEAIDDKDYKAECVGTLVTLSEILTCLEEMV